MKTAATTIAIAVAVTLAFVVARFVDNTLAPLFLNSRIERLTESHLPTIRVEQGRTIYCRMKADDFRFPLPLGSRATNLMITGSYDSVKGSVEARFDNTNRISADDYQSSLAGKLQPGGQIAARDIPGGLLIEFDYFGDR
ncbi:hypothetical protein GC207_04695 [bacterium]|nr:hypothetical protein [bacterium]